MTEQPSLLDLFEQRDATPLEILTPLAPLYFKASRAPNPFAKKFGECCGQEKVRVYWCWKCDITPGCWECFEKHKC